MSDKQLYNLSRRKLLGGIGAVGLASAGAGLGTSAYYNDTESFTDNVLEAGTLDLKVDWEEHYYDGSKGRAYVTWSEPESGNYVGFPNPNDPQVYIVQDGEGSLSDAVNAFMDATSIEAYPDENDDGIQDQNEAFEPMFPDEKSICTHDADLPTALNSDLRTSGNGQDNDPETDPDPLVSLDDVKPGDFGELTLSFHLCDNPGYVWLQGADFHNYENGLTEPESEVDTTGGDPGDGNGELLDNVQTALWYDFNGNNVVDGGTGTPLCVELVLDATGSMDTNVGGGLTRHDNLVTGAEALADAILDANANNRIGVTQFNTTGTNLLSVTSPDSQDKTEVHDAIESVGTSGRTSIGSGMETGDDDLANCDDVMPSNHKNIMIVVTDGENNESPAPGDVTVSNADEIYAVGTGGATDTELAAIADPDDPAHIVQTDNLANAIANLGQAITGGDQVFFTGTLRDLMDELTSANPNSNPVGIPLDGDRSTDYDELGGDADDPARECFANSSTNHIGLAWWVPTSVGNEIQGDSVEFDLGFYAEQCRHNTGNGMTSTTPS